MNMPTIDRRTLLIAQPRNIDTVVVDGRILRRDGAFTALDYARVLKEAADSAAALRARANWS